MHSSGCVVLICTFLMASETEHRSCIYIPFEWPLLRGAYSTILPIFHWIAYLMDL